MFLISHAIIAMVSNSLLLSLVYFYIFMQNRRSYIALWGFSWAAYSFSFIFHLFPDANLIDQTMQKQLFHLLSSLLLLFGTYSFLGKRTPRYWFAVAGLGVIWVFAAPRIEIIPVYAIMPNAVLLCFISTWTGLAFLLYPLEEQESTMQEEEKDGIDKHMIGWLFIIWGMHIGFYPFVQPDYALSPWHYISSALLTNILNIFILLFYFKETRKELARSEKRFRLLAENARDLIFFYRVLPTPGYEYVSPAALPVTGFRPEDFYENPELFFKRIHPEDKAFFLSYWNGGDEISGPMDFRWRRKDGRIIWMEMRCNEILDEANRLCGFEGIVREISERKLIESNLIKLERSRRHLLANISHDLRSPVTSILGYVTAMLDGMARESEEKDKFLKVIQKKTLSLDRLIQDLFQLTQLESQQVELTLQPVSPGELIRQVGEKYELDVAGAGLCLIRQDHEAGSGGLTGADVIVMIDHSRIDQVFDNLIQNGIRQTSGGGSISLSYELIQGGSGGGSDPPGDAGLAALFAVKDSGRGIPKAEQAYIFDRFYKVDRSRGSGGSGLGLAIAREIVLAHGGEIWVESEPGNGSTFYFAIPAAALKQSAAAG